MVEHLKKYEEFDRLNEELNLYDVKRFVNRAILMPFAPIIIAILQLTPAYFGKKVLYGEFLDIYANIDKVLIAFRAAMNDIDISDSQKEKIEYNIKKLEKLKIKYPTLEEYKIKLKKVTPYYYSVRNVNYLRNQIDVYQPHDMSLDELMKRLYVVSKQIDRDSTRTAISEPVAPRDPREVVYDPFGEEVGFERNNNNNDEDNWLEEDREKPSEFQKRLKYLKDNKIRGRGIDRGQGY